MPLPEGVRRLADPPNFATVTTLMPDGTPQSHVIWFAVDDDGEHLLVNTEPQRQKYRNVQRDPRITLTIWDRANEYDFVEVRGRVVGEVRGPAARAQQDRMSVRYTGKPYDDVGVQTERVVLRIEPEHVFALRLHVEIGETAKFTED